MDQSEVRTDSNYYDEDEVQIVEELTKKFTFGIVFWRSVVAVVISAIGVILTGASVYYSRRLEQTHGHNAFERFSSFVEDMSRSHFERVFEASRSMSLQMTADAIQQNSTSPYTTFQNYEVYATQAKKFSGLETIVYAPIVHSDQRSEFVEYAQGHKTWISSSRRLGIQLDPELVYFDIDNVTIHQDIFELNAVSHGIAPSSEENPLVPLWHTSPPPHNQDGILYNIASISELNQKFDLIDNIQGLYRDSGSGCKVSYMTVVTETIFAETFIKKQAPDETERAFELLFNEIPGSKMPHGTIVQPVFKTLDNDSKVVGHLVGSISMDSHLKNLLPEGVCGIDVVVSSSCGSVFTYMLNGSDSILLGAADLHDRAFEHRCRSIDFNDNYRDPSIAKLPGHCVFQYTICPSLLFHAGYASSLTSVLGTGISLVFLFLGGSFIVLLWLVELRHKQVVGEAALSNAIVSSLFPPSVRKRLFADRGALLPKVNSDSEVGETPHTRQNLREFLYPSQEFQAGSMRELISSKKPIADLFPACTIMFADLVGFTSWSSSRAPDDVFLLLETLYRRFDQTALELGVFKVETIGDCYVAVCGLPTPNDSHAIVMSCFARKCLRQSSALLELLVSRLGADTRNLSMRVGLHSGAVTAGVLRGERSRFQLFGDTVNTCARMESTGASGKIHVSEATADILMHAGKNKWLVSRDEAVFAKGKGTMKTFWLTTTGCAGAVEEEPILHQCYPEKAPECIAAHGA